MRLHKRLGVGTGILERRTLLPLWLAILFLLGTGSGAWLRAEPVAAGANADQLAVLNLELTNAYQGVLKIVNQPVKAYVRGADTEASLSQPGWFHPGAIRPDFNTVDIRTTQELPYGKSKFATSDVTPGLVFLGQDLEFNTMTKYFYTNRNLPKHKLTEAQMIEVNRLYRIIGKCESDIQKLTAPATESSTAASAATVQTTTNETDTEVVVPGQSFASIRAIPKQTRILYGGIAIGGLLVLVILLRVLKKKAD